MKPANALITSTGRVKLSDFGLSSASSAGIVRAVGTIAYWAPERFAASEETLPLIAGEQADIWALGLLSVTCLRGDLLPLTALESFWEIESAVVNLPLPAPPPHTSEVCRDFVNGCLQRDASERPSVAELLTHDWLLELSSGCGGCGSGGGDGGSGRGDEGDSVGDASALTEPEGAQLGTPSQPSCGYGDSDGNGDSIGAEMKPLAEAERAVRECLLAR
mmetsp:Transcript_65234/g.129087  ORF Transcript_65234/g.129087 Transcript_65234/m.129087 type:complete len:219 (-) Transcript_65234:114-770(-)